MTTWQTNHETPNPVRVEFGAAMLDTLPALVGDHNALLVTTAGFARRGLVAQLRDRLRGRLVSVLDTVQPNPDLDSIGAAANDLRDQGIEMVVALGGGSALDTAKALAFLLPARLPQLLHDHFRVGVPLPAVEPLPLIAIPTTAGTGSEVTPFATIWDRAERKKYSLASPALYPQVALLDPTLTLTLPRDVTIASGLDALSHAFESLWNRNLLPFAMCHARRAVALVLDTLPALVSDLGDLALRSTMMEASLRAGLAISQTRTALAHSISYPITAHFGLPHGLACSFSLPALLHFNAQADDGRLAGVAQWLGCASVAELQERLVQLMTNLDVPGLLAQDVPGLDALLPLAPEMFTPGRADNNLRRATVDDVRHILTASYGWMGEQATPTLAMAAWQ